MRTLLVTDPSALIALDRIGHLHILPTLYTTLAAPLAVVAEFGRRPSWLREDIPADTGRVTVLRQRLDLGEARRSRWLNSSRAPRCSSTRPEAAASPSISG